MVGDELDSAESVDVFDFAWKKFLISMAQESNSTYDFIASMSACNIMKQAIFFTESALDTFSGLNVYLDSPMVFALLGMDVPARVDSCKRLVEKAQEAGCTVMVFDHNYREAEGIISRAASWARSSEYSIDKANNVARFFHDSDMSYPEMIEFCEEIEDKLAELNITIKTTNYDVLSNDFQEDEEKLKDMIIQRYAELGQRISEEKRNSVAVDVRSIIMVYRERNGQVSSKIQTSRDIMLTLNGTIANVSKKYESNQSINAGHIPACVSADLFGAVMWLFSPVEFINYQKKQLLADCYIALRPSKALMSKYVESLIYARNAGEIDEKKFLFMRSHSVVHEALMNVTKGDYARFNERTYREVYDEITEKAEQHYRQEVAAHSETQRLWDESEEANKRTIHNLLEELKTWRGQEANRTRRMKNVVGWVYTAIFAGMPYLASTMVVEILKLVLIENTPDGWLYAGLFALVTLVIAVMCKKIKLFCFALAQKHVEARKARKVVKPSKEVLLGQKSE